MTKVAALYGILLLAHGGAPEWNAEVEKIRVAVDAQIPAEAALGMADGAAIQAAIGRLEQRGVRRIVAVPLFVNSSSEVLDQTRYLLGLRKNPSQVLRDALASLPPEAHDRMMRSDRHSMFSTRRVDLKVPVVMARALDDNPVLAEILSDRAKALSKEPARETVILIGHGPVDERANQDWLAAMGRLARRVRAKGGYKSARAATIRDDSPEAVKDKAVAGLRGLVTEASASGGRAVVVPVLIARGGIEDHLVIALTGLEYSWNGKTICPDPRIALWVLDSAAKAARDSYKRK